MRQSKSQTVSKNRKTHEKVVSKGLYGRWWRRVMGTCLRVTLSWAKTSSWLLCICLLACWPLGGPHCLLLYSIFKDFSFLTPTSATYWLASISLMTQCGDAFIGSHIQGCHEYCTSFFPDDPFPVTSALRHKLPSLSVRFKTNLLMRLTNLQTASFVTLVLSFAILLPCAPSPVAQKHF